MEQYFKIGKFVAGHGLKGELILVHALGRKTSFQGLETVFIEDKKNSFLPYFIEEATPRNDKETLVKLEGFETRESLRKLFPKDVWLKEDDFQKFAAKSSPISLLGYNLISGTESLGEILEVIEQPHQVLCAIEYKGKEALIPLHEHNLINVDHKKKQVIVELPEGLLEVYT